MDTDSKARLFGKLKLIGFFAYGVANVYVFFEVSWLLGLFMLPLFARLASRYFIHTLFDDVPRWGRRLMYQEWNGRYYEFDGRQIRVEDFGGDSGEMPLVAVEDLEALFKDKARFRIKERILPVSGLLENIASIRADKAVAWAQVISRTANPEAESARKLALFIERSFVSPKLKHDHRTSAPSPTPELWGLKPRTAPDREARDER